MGIKVIKNNRKNKQIYISFRLNLNISGNNNIQKHKDIGKKLYQSKTN